MATPRILTAEESGSGLALRVFIDSVTPALLTASTRLELHSASSKTGTYAEVTDADTRPLLIKNRLIYTVEHAAGAAGVWYKARLRDGTGPKTFSAPFAGSTRACVSLEEARTLGGISVSAANDEALTRRLLAAQTFLERETGQWFEPREVDALFPGSDTHVLSLPVPILAVEALYLDGSPQALPETQYQVCKSRTMPDDRDNPRIELVDVGRRPASRLFQRGVGAFLKGGDPHRVVGCFGYLEADGSTPQAIRDAVLTVAKRAILDPGGITGLEGPVIKRQVDRSSETFMPMVSLPKASSMTAFLAGDPTVLATIQQYRRRPGRRSVGRSYVWRAR